MRRTDITRRKKLKRKRFNNKTEVLDQELIKSLKNFIKNQTKFQMLEIFLEIERAIFVHFLHKQQILLNSF